MRHVVFLASNKVGPKKRKPVGQGNDAGWAVQKLHRKGSELEFFAAAVVERVASARGIAYKGVRSICLLCIFHLISAHPSPDIL